MLFRSVHGCAARSAIINIVISFANPVLFWPVAVNSARSFGGKAKNVPFHGVDVVFHPRPSLFLQEPHRPASYLQRVDPF